MSDETSPDPTFVPAVVVFGKDEAAKPHASCFDASEAELAEKAAGLMGMQVLRVESDEHRELVAQLPRGKVFASGRAFVPFVKAALFGQLATLVGPPGANQPLAAAVAAGDPETPPAAAPTPPKAHRPRGNGGKGPPVTPDPPLPGAWADIAPGSLVLAAVAPMDGWWEAVVIEFEDNLFTLRWRDFPDDPVFARRRWHLALLPPSTGIVGHG